MSKRIETEHPEARALEDAAWDLKSAAELFHSRAMTAETRTVLASAKRDVERVKARVLTELARRQTVRKRDKAPDDALEPVPQQLLDVGDAGGQGDAYRG